MSSKRKFSNVEINESSASIANSLRDICDSDSSDSSDFLFPVIKHCKQLIIRDDTDDEEHNNHQLSEEWIWEEKNNIPKIII